VRLTEPRFRERGRFRFRYRTRGHVARDVTEDRAPNQTVAIVHMVRERKATEYFTELESDRSENQWKMPELMAAEAGANQLSDSTGVRN
jgi:hypothetical protein